MQSALVILAVVTLLLYIYEGVEVTLGARKLAHLDRVRPIDDQDAPRISVIVPACNEERGIETALASVLQQDYPHFEVIAVDDRSTDSTGAILDRMGENDSRLRALHIRELQAGWLGKNHALQTGAAEAAGDLLLFTDADVVMDPSVLRRAAAYFMANELDHLAIAPRATVWGFFSNAFLGVFALGFSLYTKPWKVRNPKSRKHIGIGAFNLVRASAYRSVAGHTRIAMRPDDDIKLGKVLKMRGYRQDFVFGTHLLSVDWYHSFAEMRRGLMKNLFAGADYRAAVVVLSTFAQVVLLIWPFVALATTGGWVLFINALIVGVLCTLFWFNSRLVAISGWWCFALPLGCAVLIYLMWRAMILTLLNQGIEWRGTRYRLAQLRANRI